MTQYKRITGKVFGGNATATGNDPEIAQFGSALAGTFVGTTDVETIQQLPAWGKGFISAVTPDTQFPALPETTGALKVLSHQICNILQEGVSTWDSGTIYYKGNYVSKNGNLFVSKTDTNQGNNPETDNSNWTNPIDGQWVLINPVLLSGATTAGTYNIGLSSYLPNDNYIYEILISITAASTAAAGSFLNIKTDIMAGALTGAECGNYARSSANTMILPVGETKTLTITIAGGGAGAFSYVAINMYGYRRMGKNN